MRLAASTTKHIMQLTEADEAEVESSLDGFFVCLADGCAEGETIYHDRSQWESHVRENHPQIWGCTSRSHETHWLEFPSYQEYAEHVKSEHPDSLDKLSMADLAEAHRVPDDCFMCSSFDDDDAFGGDESKALLGHMAPHFRMIHMYCKQRAHDFRSNFGQ
ncbi:hypothetical protein M434DRAFT_32945 [Hypoxylon sp. CO27-5]|nr:hypothetical protein M434DRAFT_32945 [Hypoxylon sp. CO27-5]